MFIEGSARFADGGSQRPRIALHRHLPPAFFLSSAFEFGVTFIERLLSSGVLHEGVEYAADVEVVAGDRNVRVSVSHRSWRKMAARDVPILELLSPTH